MIIIRRIAAALAAAAIILTLTAAQANADDDEYEEEERDQTAESICVAADLGQTPRQIADNINDGDPRWNKTRAWQKTWMTLIVEGCE